MQVLKAEARNEHLSVYIDFSLEVDTWIHVTKGGVSVASP